MIIPNTIRIGGQDISIVNEERLDNDILGDICIAEGTLRIADNFKNCKQCQSSKITTFIHEVVHGILDTMGEFKLSENEKFVSTFSSLLVNPIEDIVKANNNTTVSINTPLSDINTEEVHLNYEKNRKLSYKREV